MTAPTDYYAEQTAADEWLADQTDDWPDHDTCHHMLRHGRWKPVDDLDDIANYPTPPAA